LTWPVDTIPDPYGRIGDTAGIFLRFRWFSTPATGVDGQTPVDLDEVDLIVIAPLPSWDCYQNLADFADGITNERAGRRLAHAIQGKGAFRLSTKGAAVRFPRSARWQGVP